MSPIKTLFIFLLGLGITLPTWSAQSSTPSLGELLQRVWQEHPRVQAAEAVVEAARALGEAADRPVYNPELEIDAEQTDIDTYSIGLNQTIDWGNQRDAQTLQAEAEVQAAMAVLADVRQQTGVEVLTVLANYQMASQLRKLAQERMELLHQLRENTQQRRAAGDISELDVALARVAFSEAQMQLAHQRAELATQQAALVAASGQQFKQWPALSDIPALSADIDSEELLAKLPALMQLTARWQAAKAGAQLIQASRTANPTLGLRGGQEASESLIGLSLSIPLQIRNRYSAEIRAADIQSLEAEKILLDARQRAAARLTGSRQRYQLTYDAWQNWQKTGQTTLEQQSQLLKRIWQAGELSTAEYLVQAKQNVDAREAAIELASDMWLAWTDWLSASGQIETWLRNGQ
jgi:cobalt-zinc-cadmium efflux system outer membrane protein